MADTHVSELDVVDHDGSAKGFYLGGTLITATAAELNTLDGITASVSELNTLDGVTATAAEINELDLSVVGGARKIKTINITAPADGTEQDTGWDLPAKAIVLGVYLDVNTAESTGTTKTIDVGTDGSGSDDPNGFLAGVSVASTGLVKGTLANGGQTLGALLSVDEDGAGALVPEPDISSGGESITFTAGSADFNELDADIIIDYIEIA